MPKALQPHPDRALPAGPARDVARRIHASTKDLPLLCLHGHVDIGLFATDAPFGNPAADPREIWREFCTNWHLFLGTPSRYWLEHEFAEDLGLTVHPSAETAD